MKSDGFNTEAELCDAFVEAAALDGWDAYPEVDGYDVVLVWNGSKVIDHVARRRYADEPADVPIPVGYQVGVDAKLRAHIDVLDQAASRYDNDPFHDYAPGGKWEVIRKSPDEHAVLVPEASAAFCSVARRLKLRVLTLEHCRDTPDPEHRRTFSGSIKRTPIWPMGEPRTGPRLALPPVPLQGSGGKASPRVMSPWRVRALRLCTLLNARGHLTGKDFADAKMDRRIWLARGWLVSDGRDEGFAKYVRATGGPDVGYERERDALAAKESSPTCSACGSSGRRLKPYGPKSAMVCFQCAPDGTVWVSTPEDST